MVVVASTDVVEDVVCATVVVAVELGAASVVGVVEAVVAVAVLVLVVVAVGVVVVVVVVVDEVDVVVDAHADVVDMRWNTVPDGTLHCAKRKMDWSARTYALLLVSIKVSAAAGKSEMFATMAFDAPLASVSI